MNRKYRRQLELGIVALGISCLFLLWLVIAIGFWQMAQAQDVTGSALSSQPHTPTTSSIGPDISWCFTHEGQAHSDLWDCIRNAEYARQQEDSE